MRKRLLAAAAIAPLSLLAWQPAHAQTETISSTTSTQLSTATAVSGGPGDIDIASGGVVQPTVAGPAVTLNSNNAITVEGTIQTKDLNAVAGIQVAPGGFTGSVTNSGSINLTESYSAPTNGNSYGITEAPFASPTSTNRYGILVNSAAGDVFNGSIDNAGAITIQGDHSAGIVINGLVAGATGTTGATGNPSILNSGTITVTGDSDFGIYTAPKSELSGELQVLGGITMKGQASTAIQTNGQIDGALAIYSSITTGGYAIDTRVTGTSELDTIETTAADVEQGGSALQVRGNVLGGVYIAAPPPGTVSTNTTADVDGDGVLDYVEGTASLTTYGSAPAIQIGSSSGAITLGNLNSASTNYAFGLVVAGDVSAQGIFDGVSATAIDIGSGLGTANPGVNLTGGIDIISTASISAVSYSADALGIHLESGTVAPQFWTSGAITTSVTSSAANNSTVVLIAPGATVNTFLNFGTLTAAAVGDNINAQVVVDKSGTISTVYNQGVVQVSFTPTTVGQADAGKEVAFDLSANTTGIYFNQSLNTGVVVLPQITGDIYLGSGPNTVDLLSGNVYGALEISPAAASSNSSLTLAYGATYIGPLTFYSGNGATLAVNNQGKLQDNSPTTINASNFTLGSQSQTIVAIDPVNGAQTKFIVNGTGTIVSGAQIGATMLSAAPLSGETFTIVQTAGAGTLAGSATPTLGNLPYLFNGSLQTNIAAGTIDLTVSTKSAAQLGFNKAETAAFPAILAGLPQDPGIQTAVVSATTRGALISTYDQLLPNSNGDVFETALGFSKAVSRATADRFDLSREQSDEEIPSKSGFWVSEFFSGVDQDKQANTDYHSAGLGVIGGYDFGGTGMTVSASSANVTRPNVPGDSSNSVSVVEGGLYAAPRWGPLSLDARVGVGYLKVSDRRQLSVSTTSLDLSQEQTVSRTAEGDWQGYDLSAHLGAGVELDVNKHLFFQPKVYADLFDMHEGAYSERNIGNPLPTGYGSSFEYDVSARNSTQTNATVSVVTGTRFGSSFIFSPQLELGYDDVLEGGPGNTTVHAEYSGAPVFTLPSNQMTGGAMARLTLRGDGNFVHFALQAGGEYNHDYHSVDLKAVFRMSF